MRRLFWDFKSIRYYALVPPALLLLGFPLYLFLVYTVLTPYDPQDTGEIYTRAQELIPFLSVWWSTFVLREQLESDGSEVFTLYRKSCLPLFAEFLLPYLLLTILLFAGLSFFFEGMLPLLVMVLLQVIFLYALDFFLIFALKSTALAMLLVVVYSAAMTILPAEHIGPVSIFSLSGAPLSPARIGVMLGLSLLFTAAGNVRAKHLYR